MQIIDTFLNQTNSDLALLINGDWGIGKTHFIKEKLIPEIESSGKKVFYISLHGVKSVNEIFSQILFQKNKFLQKTSKSRYGRIAIGVLKSAASIGISNFSPINLNQSDNYIEISDITNFENSVIIFDDLERKNTSTDIKDLLGEISNVFISQDAVKVIFIANEFEIDKLDSYYKIKEKIIGWTAKFELSPIKLLNSLNQKYEVNEPFFKFIDAYKEFMVSLISHYEIKNIRSVIFFYNCLEIIYSKISLDTFLSKKDIYYSTFVICMEYKNGTFQKYGTDKTVPYFISRYKRDISIPNHNNEDAKLEERFSLYVSNSLMKDANFDFEYIFIESLFDFVLTGKADQTKLNLEFQEIEKQKKKNLLSKLSQACKGLRGVFYLSNEKYLFHLNIVIDTMNNGKVTLSEFVFASSTLCYLSDIPELNLEMPYVEGIIEKHILIGVLEEENNYLSHSFIDRYLSEIEKYNKKLGKRVKKIVSEIVSKKEKREYVEKWKNEITSISDGRTMLIMLKYITKEELLKRIMVNINDPNFLEHLSFLIKRAFHDENQYYHIFKDQLIKLEYVRKELKILSKSGKYKLVELVWINEFIKEITIIMKKSLNQTA